GLDLDEVVAAEHAAGGGVDLRAQPQRLGRAFAAQIQVAVAQARLLPRLVVELERQGRGLAEHLERGDVDLDRAGGDLRVLVALGADLDHAGDLDAELRAQPVGGLGDRGFAEDDLADARGVTQVDEDHPAVVAPTIHPAGERDGGVGVLGSQGSGLVGAQHCRGVLPAKTMWGASARAVHDAVRTVRATRGAWSSTILRRTDRPRRAGRSAPRTALTGSRRAPAARPGQRTCRGPPGWIITGIACGPVCRRSAADEPVSVLTDQL